MVYSTEMSVFRIAGPWSNHFWFRSEAQAGPVQTEAHRCNLPNTNCKNQRQNAKHGVKGLNSKSVFP
jgi:hypothetical protein